MQALDCVLVVLDLHHRGGGEGGRGDSLRMEVVLEGYCRGRSAFFLVHTRPHTTTGTWWRCGVLYHLSPNSRVVVCLPPPLVVIYHRRWLLSTTAVSLSRPIRAKGRTECLHGKISG